MHAPTAQPFSDELAVAILERPNTRLAIIAGGAHTQTWPDHIRTGRLFVFHQHPYPGESHPRLLFVAEPDPEESTDSHGLLIGRSGPIPARFTDLFEILAMQSIADIFIVDLESNTPPDHYLACIGDGAHTRERLQKLYANTSGADRDPSPLPPGH